jgi:hypothetical protein
LILSELHISLTRSPKNTLIRRLDPALFFLAGFGRNTDLKKLIPAPGRLQLHYDAQQVGALQLLSDLQYTTATEAVQYRGRNFHKAAS